MRHLVWAVLPLAALPTLAQPGPQGTVRDTVVVTAALVAEDAEDLPSTTRTVDGAEIEARQSTSVVDLLGLMPGAHPVVAGSPGQQASLFVRGADPDQTLVLWNGIPLNDPFFGGFNFAFLATEAIDRVELAAGPFSALFGSSAAGGVVQVVTRSEPGRLLVSTEIGEEEVRRLGLSGAVGGDPWTLQLSGHLRQGNGYFANDELDSRELAPRLSWQATARRRLALQGRYHDSETGIPFSDGHPSLRRRLDWEEWQWALPAEVAGRRWGLEGLLSSARSHRRFTDPEDLFGFTEAITDTTSDRARFVYSRRPGGAWWAALGAEGERQEVSDESVFGRNLDGVRQEIAALFGQLHWQGPRWAVEAGLRYDDSDAFGTATSPRLGVVVRLPAQWRLRAGYGEGFRAPSLGELFFPFFGNPELAPEESDSTEIGLAWQQAGWSLDLVGFRNRFSNLIEFQIAAGGNVNTGQARTEGLEAVLGLQRGWWQARFAASWLEAENVETGQRLLRRPERTATLSWTARPGRWTLSMSARHVGERSDLDPVSFAVTSNPAFTRADVAVAVRLPRSLSPTLRVENLWDEDYQEALGFPAPGRVLTAGLRWER